MEIIMRKRTSLIVTARLRVSPAGLHAGGFDPFSGGVMNESAPEVLKINNNGLSAKCLATSAAITLKKV